VNSGGMMKKSYVAFLLTVILALSPVMVLAQGFANAAYIEFNNIGGGARAAGMGGAYLGLSEGEYAYSWNPAAMIFADKPVIGLQFKSANDKFKQGYIGYNDSLRTSHNYTYDAKRKHSFIDFGGFVAPFTFMDRQWAVGGGYRNVFDMKVNYEIPGLITSSSSSGVDAISVSISGKIMEGIGLGVTGNSYIRGTESNAFVLNYSPNIWENSNDHYSGFNFDIGLTGKFSMFQGSAVVHTPYDLKNKAKVTDYLMLPTRPAGTINRVTTTTNIPLGFSIGLAAKPIEKLTVDIDFDSRPMSKSDININWENRQITDTTFSSQWKDLNQFRIGVEYLFDAGFAKVPVRAGFRNEPTVASEMTTTRPDSITTWTYGKQIKANIMSFGTGLRFEKAWVDFAYQFGSGKNNAMFDFYGSSSTIGEKSNYSRIFISAGMNF
jgi:hypothetical protein